jgi:hypothetical protein
LRNAVELGLPADENVATFFTFFHSWMQMPLMVQLFSQTKVLNLASPIVCSLLTLLNMVQVLSYWAIAVPVVLWYSLATPGPLAGLVEFFQGPMHANTFRCASDIGEHFALRVVNACTCFGSLE